MKTITQSQLVALLEAIKGASIIGIEALTDAKALKTNNPYKNKAIFKKTRACAFVGANYERAVNNELLSTGNKPEFKSAGLPDYYEQIVPGKVLRHKTKGTFYIQTQSRPGQRRTVPARLLGYFDADGKPISKSDAEKYLPVKGESVKQASAGLDGKENQIWFNIYKIESLLRVRVAGISYKVTA